VYIPALSQSSSLSLLLSSHMLSLSLCWVKHNTMKVHPVFNKALHLHSGSKNNLLISFCPHVNQIYWYKFFQIFSFLWWVSEFQKSSSTSNFLPEHGAQQLEHMCIHKVGWNQFRRICFRWTWVLHEHLHSSCKPHYWYRTQFKSCRNYLYVMPTGYKKKHVIS
jgi:hypothetical protein